ncbi:MAG: HAD-IIA family hydrolase [Kineosporiaceae bacterium]|nr:HAD-IIA family hydrolase [Kineosporiaceae bacterium]
MSGLEASERPLCEIHDLAVVDLDGVVYVGPDPVPGAPEAIAGVQAAGMRLCYLTNNASRTPDTVADHLRRLSITVDVSEVLTSAQVGAALLAERLPAGSRVLVIGGEGLRVALTEQGLVPVATMDDTPDAVAQGFNPDLTWRLLAEGTRAVRAGLPWLATNLDLTVPTPFGPAPGNGSLVAAVATAGGRRPDLVAGKPQPEPFLDAVKRYGAAAPVAVGDRLDTDLEGARAAGMPGLAVMTGVSGVGDLVAAPPSQRPTYLAADLSGLLHPHPAVDVQTTGGVTARCREATVAVESAGEDEDATLVVRSIGTDPVDLLRAACGAAWAWRDARTGVSKPPSSDDVWTACRRFETAAAWAR